jgi:hypothetical protein
VFGDALGAFETVVVDSDSPEQVASYVEGTLIVAFGKWTAAEQELREIAQV